MKLIYCNECQDMFKLDIGNMRWCKCGAVSGRYVNNVQAEVSYNAVCIAIGNGALYQAIADMQQHRFDTGDLAKREEYYQPNKGLISHAWIRPSEGAGNPHSKVLKPKIVKRRWVNVDKIELTNNKIDDSKVDAMIEAGLKTEQMALPAWFDGKKWWLTDGNHRFTAIKLLGMKKAPIAQMTREEYDWVKFSNRKVQILVKL